MSFRSRRRNATRPRKMRNCALEAVAALTKMKAWGTILLSLLGA